MKFTETWSLLWVVSFKQCALETIMHALFWSFDQQDQEGSKMPKFVPTETKELNFFFFFKAFLCLIPP